MMRKSNRNRRYAAALCAVALGACQGAETPAEIPAAEVEAISAAIDSLIEQTMDSAGRVDAEGVLAATRGVDPLTIMVGDVILSGYEPILARFQDSYSGLREQHHVLMEKQIRVLTRDVALVLLTAEGTYTDKAGWQSDPVGLGLTLVLVREAGQWRISHAHQSTIG